MIKLNSSKGTEMIRSISPIYNRSLIMQSIFEAIGKEFDDIYVSIDEIILQLFPQTATWGLKYWEELLKIPTNTTIFLERRRDLVITRIKLRAPMTPKRISSVIKSLAGKSAEFVEVKENVEPHVFRVIIGTKKIGLDYSSIYKEIKRIKPSHESFYLGNSYLRTFSLNKDKNFGFSKIIHAIGTFVTSKEDRGFISTKGYRSEDLLSIKKSKSFGESYPFAISENLTYSTKGFLNYSYIQNLIDRVIGYSDPVVIKRDLVYTTMGFINDEMISQKANRNKGTSKVLVCNKNLKYTRIEVI